MTTKLETGNSKLAGSENSPSLQASSFQSLILTLRMIKFEHSVFALPFAFIGALLAAGGWPTWQQVLWIVVAMVGGRSAAMTFNRIADLQLDKANPRTANRELPTGQLSLGFAWVFTIVSSAALVLAAWQLNPLALKLSPFVLAILFLYSYTKRFTALSHWVLGFTLGMAPAGAWVAIRGTLDLSVALLTVAVMFWVTGFDIIYSCQDVEHDRRAGLYSVPARLGVGGALWISRVLHLLMVGVLAYVVFIFQLGVLAVVGLALTAILLGWEHSLVKANDLSRVNAAFFSVNGYISVLLLLFWGADVLL